MTCELTAELARQLLDYDPTTGVLTRKESSGHVKKGSIAGTPHSCGYINVGVNNKRYFAHRIAWLITYGRWPIGEVDHRNGVKNDNRIANLRECFRAENAQNLRRARRDNKCGLLGASPKRNKWQASIRLESKSHNLGVFETPQEAHAAYLRAKSAMHPFSTFRRAP